MSLADRAGDVAAADDGPIVPHQATDVLETVNCHAGEAHIADGVAAIGDAEQAHVHLNRTFDRQAADDVTGAIERAGKSQRGVANGLQAPSRRIGRCLVPVLGAAGVNVVGQLERFAEQAGAGHALHTVDVGELIGRGTAAVATQRTQEGAAGNAQVIDGQRGQGGGQLLPVATLQRQRLAADGRSGADAAAGCEVQAAAGKADRRVDVDIAACAAGVQKEVGSGGPGDAAIDGDETRAGCGLDGDVGGLQLVVERGIAGDVVHAHCGRAAVVDGPGVRVNKERAGAPRARECADFG